MAKKIEKLLISKLTYVNLLYIVNRDKNMQNKNFLTTTELAKLLGISRVAVFKKIKKGEIKAEKIGRNFVIHKKELGNILGKSLTRKEKLEIEKGVKKVVKEYGETLRLLGNT